MTKLLKMVKLSIKRGVLAILCVALLLQLHGCSSNTTSIYPEKVAIADSSDHGILVKKLRHQYEGDPSDFSLLIKLREAEHAASEFYLAQGESLIAIGEPDGALLSFEQGLKLNKNSYTLITARQRLLNAREAENLLRQASQNFSSGKTLKAKELLEEAIKLDGNNPELVVLQDRILERMRREERAKYIIDLKFDNLEFKKAIIFVAKTYGINVVFDDGIKDTPISLDMEKVPFSEAINILTGITRNAYKVLSQDTLLIFPDTTERRRQHDEILIRTFVLETMKAKDMAVLLRSALGIKNLTINEANNAVILRETEEMSYLAEQLIRANDVSPGEVILDVEILEVNLSDAEKLGVDYGNYQISTLTTAVPIVGSIGDSLRNATTLSIPSINLNAFKQAVDAKMLAKPSVRVLDGQKAKIHIGDRVPLRQSSIQDATGQTRTTFEYQEIGIRFNVEAKIHSNDQITIQVALEVSALGENLGTATEQAFRIGTRNADTTMLVRDGETAILGGLLREEGRSTTSGINGLSSLAILKRVFGSEEISSGRTDLLLTITPNIIRRSNRASADQRHIAAGTEASMQDRSRVNQLDRLVLRPHSAATTVISTEREKYNIVIDKADNAAIPNPAQTFASQAPEDQQIAPLQMINIQFDEPQYEGSLGEAHTITVDFNQQVRLRDFELEVAFNSNILSVDKITPEGDGMQLSENDAESRSSFSLAVNQNSNNLASFDKVVSFEVTPKRKGTSFLTLRVVQAVDEDGAAVNIKSQNSRFIVK